MLFHEIVYHLFKVGVADLLEVIPDPGVRFPDLDYTV
jgi:hypothetical protein